MLNQLPLNPSKGAGYVRCVISSILYNNHDGIVFYLHFTSDKTCFFQILSSFNKSHVATK